MIVYRFEDENGLGPYIENNQNINFAHDDDKHLSPREEGLEINSLHCGFKGMEQIHRWFTNDEIIKMNQDFMLVSYSIGKKHVNIGKQQVTFDLNKATKLSKYKPESLI